MPIYKTATYQVRLEHIPAIKAAAREYVEAIKATEPGTFLYVALQDMINHQRFVHFYGFENEAAETLHSDAPATKRFSQQLQKALSGDEAFGDFNLIATTE
jgi:quinol monooxygenase YgiN